MTTARKGVHHLKTWPVFFEACRTGKKTFEIRNDDRHFEEGDEVVLCEWDPAKAEKREADGYTGRELRGTISYLLIPSDCPSDAVKDGFVVFACNWPTTVATR